MKGKENFFVRAGCSSQPLGREKQSMYEKNRGKMMPKRLALYYLSFYHARDYSLLLLISEFWRALHNGKKASSKSEL